VEKLKKRWFYWYFYIIIG